MGLIGRSILGAGRSTSNGAVFYGRNPVTGEQTEQQFYSASREDLDCAARLAEEAFSNYAKLPGKRKANFLRTIAAHIDGIRAEVIERAHVETALPTQRLEGEVNRTSNQLRFFADFVEEGSWCDARIDLALPERKPLPRPDVRSVLRPLGPLGVFGASNFPFAFSVAGGDTASALAAGNPVIVKAHSAHPGTSELVGEAIAKSVKECDLPEGVFSLLFDSGTQIGAALVQHPLIKAVAFTGSLSGGRALMDLASERPDPIPCYTEMSSTNPVFLLPGALAKHAKQIAIGLHGSVTMGAGQFCTKPGLVFVPQIPEGSDLMRDLSQMVASTPSFNMLTAGIAANFNENVVQRQSSGATLVSMSEAAGTQGFLSRAALFEAELEKFLAGPVLATEMFGPGTLVIRYKNQTDTLRIARALSGHLTATLFGNSEDLEENVRLIEILTNKVGRLIVNAYPTGVEVCQAMVHGGPYPATSDGHSTSVGGRAILRFCRAICYQGFPQTVLPPELQDSNPLGIFRLVNGTFTKEPVRGTSVLLPDRGI